MLHSGLLQPLLMYTWGVPESDMNIVIYKLLSNNFRWMNLIIWIPFVEIPYLNHPSKMYMHLLHWPPDIIPILLNKFEQVIRCQL